MSKIDEPNAMELAPIAEARMIFGRSLKEHVERVKSLKLAYRLFRAECSSGEASKIDEPNAK